MLNMFNAQKFGFRPLRGGLPIPSTTQVESQHRGVGISAFVVHLASCAKPVEGNADEKAMNIKPTNTLKMVLVLMISLLQRPFSQ